MTYHYSLPYFAPFLPAPAPLWVMPDLILNLSLIAGESYRCTANYGAQTHSNAA